MATKKSSSGLHHLIKAVLFLIPTLLLVAFFYLQLQTITLLSPIIQCATHQPPAAVVDDLVGRLRESVTFLPLMDTRRGFIGEMDDSDEPAGEAKHLVFPSEASAGRVLCVSAPPGAAAAYALAWADALPAGAVLRRGLAFVSDSPYDYRNLWHGVAALAPFASWHGRSRCAARPARWALFHRGAARAAMAPWLAALAEATTGVNMTVETFDDTAAMAGAVCFEDAVVFRRNMAGLSRERLRAAFDLMRCRARARCGVAGDGGGGSPAAALRVTLLLRTGARAFKDEAAVTRVFGRECARVAGCALTAAHSDNLTFCDQVRLLSATDVLISVHGAQMANLLFMERNSSVMELYPLGWRQRAGGGQFVFRWMADRAGMRHEGSWWDPHGEPCPGSPDILSCYKNRQIGLDEKYFAQWAARVFTAAKERKMNHGVGAPAGEPQRQVAPCLCK
ncbi:hypothetical protein ACP4OV_031138 [Aristida adscensionis]